MHQLNDFDYFGLSSVFPGIVDNQKSKEIKCYFLKYIRKIRVALILFVTILTIIYFLKCVSFSRIRKSEKTKRSVNMNNFKENQDIITTSKINIEVIPQNRRMNQPPNHRYFEKALENDSQTLIIRLNAREGWHSKPFESKISKHFGQTQDIISKGEFSVQKPKEQSKLVNELLTDLGSSMRLKGFYLKSESEKDVPKNHLDGKHTYSKEINNLMQNNFSGGEERKKSTFKSLKFKSRGEPFQLPTEGRESLYRKKITRENHNLNQVLKKNPITLYLEFYPMKDLQDLKRKFKPNSNVFKNSENKFHTSEISYSFNVEKIILPQDKRNRMIMKLNLYPKESNFSKHHFSKQRKISRSKYNTKAERKSFGWFLNKKKKNNSKECSITRMNPHRKRLIAKWKNEQGERIHADLVAMKNLKNDIIGEKF